MSRSNIFLIINLGCEMLYVIDQRLKAQNISLEKSAQVVRDITCVLLDSKFLKQLIHPHPDQHLLTPHQCRILLSDIACCSLMRLDIKSMDKLWDLMVMVFKWQMSIVNESQDVLDITFRHMDGISRILPEMKKSILIDNSKRLLIEFWDHINECERNNLVKCLCNWLHPFSIKISVLIRLGFQLTDGTFEHHQQANDLFHSFAKNIGENIYHKSSILEATDTEAKEQNSLHHNRNHNKLKSFKSCEIDTLVSQLNINQTIDYANENNDENLLEQQQQQQQQQTQKQNIVLDQVTCELGNKNELHNKINKNLKEQSIRNDGDIKMSEFIQIESRSITENIFERFRMENKLNNDVVVVEDGTTATAASPTIDAYDATEDLLKMLDEN